MARRVLNDGNPASDNVVLLVPFCSGKFPLLGCTLTKANQLVCWPVLPDRVCAPSEERRLQLIDHVTLDLRNRRSHSTSFRPEGERDHPRKWTLCQFPESRVSFWFGFAVRVSIVENQLLERHQWIRSPTPDTERRIDEVKQFTEKLRFVDVHAHEFDEATGNAVIALVYLVDDTPVRLSERLVEFLSEWPDEFWDARPEINALNVVSTGFAVSGVQVGLLLCFPPSKLREDGPILFTPRQHCGK